MSAALQTRQLSAELGGRQVLKSIDLQITAGRWTCVVGPNGAGKSTLLKAMAGLLPHSGQVLWHGQPTCKSSVLVSPCPNQDSFKALC